MKASIRLGTIRGIEVGIHYSWFIVFAVFSAILATEQYPDLYEGWSDAAYWTVGIASVLLLFVSVLVHEFGHAIVAQRKGVPVTSIVLFIFGGVATIGRESETPGDEFKIAIAGPITSTALAVLFWMAWLVLGSTSEQVSALLGYISFINLVLAVFNLIPGFPLDGGRVLRAVLWKATSDERKATRIVSAIGVGIGTLLFFVGVVAILDGALANGLWSIALGWFLQSAASQGYSAVAQRELTRGVRVCDLMDPDPITVSPRVSIQELIDDYILGHNVRGLPVVDDGSVLGIVSLTDVKELPRDAWSRTEVAGVMTPRDRLFVLSPETPLDDALRLMAEHDLNQIPVVDGQQLVGLVTRSGVVRYLSLREELGLDDRSARRELQRRVRAGT